MDRMFRVLGFWTLAIGLMALAGDFIPMALLFFRPNGHFRTARLLEAVRTHLHIAFLGLHDSLVLRGYVLVILQNVHLISPRLGNEFEKGEPHLSCGSPFFC